MLTRRALVGAGLLGGGFSLSACTPTTRATTPVVAAAPPPVPPMYQALLDEPYPVPAVPVGEVDPAFWRAEVADPTGQPPGTIVVDPEAKYLWFTQEGGRAMRYGIGVGRQGFEWSGDAIMQWKRPWPTWTPPAEMIAREPELEKYSAANGGHPPGLDNPLGARALYLFQNGEDTLYRIHGTNEPWSIGRAVSSGCIRLLNQDVIDLYDRVPNGTRVVVRNSRVPSQLSDRPIG